MLPRRFRTRVLAAVIATGLCILIGTYYVPSGRFLRRVRQPSRLWTLLWPEPPESCPVRNPISAYQHLDTADVYPELDFTVPDNGGMGFWNDDLETRYRVIRSKWKTQPLKVIVVPHSHVDPGWLRTFEEYHRGFVSHILDNMVMFLNKSQDFKFIWSEISFFSEWWKKINESTRMTVKTILQRKQLEFVTGGWVMPDEAVTSYFAVIDQLVEGHQWLQHFIGILPKYSWSVDVFGHSASYPYILSSAGISAMVIMRTHYAWKKFLAQSQAFDFYWQQAFSSPRMLCHMAPSDLYSFKYACGPDTVVCLRYDFRQIDQEYSESTAERITNENAELKASHLLTQYGRFASLFPHNVLLVPLGDDFRYNVHLEWSQQLENYKKLFDYINNRKDWNAHIQFGTVSDYFEEVSRRIQNTNISLQTIAGDFFPYADIYANFRPSYWTGFYTTRPFYKKLAHELEYWLRISEILCSFAKSLISGSLKQIITKDYAFLISARQKLALFQHHDAITGTSKEIVMRDYGQKLHTGIVDAMSVVSHMTQILLLEHNIGEKAWTSRIYPDVYRSNFNKSTRKLSISVPENGRKIILFNSLTVERTEVIRLKIKSPLIKVTDSDSNDVPFQIIPIFKDELTMSNLAFELLFVASLKPLSYTSYTLVGISKNEKDKLPKTVVSLSLNNGILGSHTDSTFRFEKPDMRKIVFDSPKIRVTFSHLGNLQSIYLKESGILKLLNIDFLSYVPWMHRSGAYLFCPERGIETPIQNLTDHFPLLSVIRGPIRSELNVMYHDILKFSIRLYHFENAPPALELDVMSDISKVPRDIELIMRIKSDILNKEVFYTDSNGFQMLKRKYVSDLPVEGNYYPATSTVFIEDSYLRLNLLFSHSHGVTSSEGQVEVMLDRKIRYDDGRGVGEGIEDSQTYSALFWLIPEPTVSSYKIPKQNIHISSQVFLMSLFLQYPPTVLVTEYEGMELIKNNLEFLDESWPSDVHLINLRTLPNAEDYNIPSNDSLMIVYQSSETCRSKTFVDAFISVKPYLFSVVKVKSVTRTSITGTAVVSDDVETETSFPVLQACKITFGE